MSLGFRMGVTTLVCAPLLALACGTGPAGVERKNPSGSGSGSGSGATGSGSGATGSGSGSGSTGAGGTISVDPDAGLDPDAQACQQFTLEWVPQTPTVFVLVDRSATMFDVGAAGTDAWTPLKTGVLQVVEDLQADVRFGFAAFTGEDGKTCPTWNSVAPAENNFDAISTEYSGLMKINDSDTPTGMALSLARDVLVNDTTPGGKYILFATDGEPDYCDNGNPLCPVDSVVHQLQLLAAENIQTFIFSVTTTSNQIPGGTLEAWANAGRGLPVALITRPNGQALADHTTTLYYECNPVAPWLAEYTALGLTGTNVLGTYTAAGTPGGDAPVYRPDLADQTALTEAIRSLVQGLKSCSFDLQDQVKINLMRANEGIVSVQGTPITYDATGTNGWNMATETQMQLTGEACTLWQQPSSTDFAVQFPCDVIIPPPK